MTSARRKRPLVLPDQSSSKLSLLENPPPNEPITIDKMPDEMLLKIFSYLGHGDKLNVRLVCRRWNRELSFCPGFNNSVFYLLKVGTDAKVTLKCSKTPWKKLRIEKWRLVEMSQIKLPYEITKNISCLEFSKSIVSWQAVQKVLIQFPSVEELNIIQCKRRRKEKANANTTRVTRGNEIFQGKLERIFGNVKCLNLELRRISDITFYLEQVQESINFLLAFSIREIVDGIETVTESSATRFLEVLYNVIKSSHRTLKTLQIHLYSRLIINRFFPEVIDRLRREKIRLDLLTFDIRHFSSESNNFRDAQIFSEFLRSQNNLMRLRLPLPPSDWPVEICRSILHEIPPLKIRCIHVSHHKYLVPNFLDIFTQIRHLETDFDFRQYLLNNKKFPLLYALEMQRGVLTNSVPILTETFLNLQELNINGDESTAAMIDDRSLQAISQNLKKLRSLVLGACARITDYGVTGIRKEYCERLFKSRSICLEPKLEIPSEEIIGTPLCSIPGLVNLMFTGATAISDIGIYYGFRFKELRFLNIRNNTDISDLGLDWLGRFNSNLEEVFIGVGPWITSVGLTHFRNRLRRIKRRHCIFVWANQDYYSSDESYAMESEEEEDNRQNLGVPHNPAS